MDMHAGMKIFSPICDIENDFIVMTHAVINFSGVELNSGNLLQNINDSCIYVWGYCI